MKTYIADIIPKIQRFSKRLDDLTKLTNQHWVSLGEITQSKRVFIFRPNNQLLISENGIVEKGAWEYLGNQSLLLDTKHESYLLRHGFFDENVIALKLDSTDNYAFFVNESKYHSELNTIDDILKFLENRYIKGGGSSSGLGTTKKQTINEKFEYKVTAEKEMYDLIWGSHTEYQIEFTKGITGNVYRGGNSGKYFYVDVMVGKQYCDSFDGAVYELYVYLQKMNNR